LIKIKDLFSASQVEVFLGSNNPNTMPLRIIVTQVFTKVFWIHPSFSTRTLANDIALIKLPTTVTTTVAIKPIQIYKGTDQLAGKVLTVSGYGLDETNSLPSLLQFTEVIGISRTECTLTFGSVFITDKVLCVVGYPDKNRGTCSGDSGGPLITKDAIPLQVGVVSFGSASGCLSSKPQGFTRVSSYASWIEKTMLN
jgi:secreted trypsin-like serine protease